MALSLGDVVPGAAHQAPPPATAARWLRRYARLLIAVDVGALALASLLAVLLRFGFASAAQLGGVPYYLIAPLIAIVWITALAVGRCYELRFLGNGTEEFRRVGDSSVRVVALVALVSYATGLEVARGFIAVMLPSGMLLLVLGRWWARRWLHAARRAGRCSHRVVVVGNAPQVRDLTRLLTHGSFTGLQVVGACVPESYYQQGLLGGGLDVPVVGTPDDLLPALVALQADTVAVAASPSMTPGTLRTLSYRLEGTGVDLLVAPALTNITGSRISIRPVAGLPLMHVDEPELRGARKVVKGVFDWLVALVLVVLLAPALLIVALLIRTTSPGPAIFRQQRVGRDGHLFEVWKFRSMHVDAEEQRAMLESLNEHDGVLFKLRADPRVTRVGGWLRKTSLDELPQLLNVLRGDMSLVGPRPPLPSEVERYEGHAHRRLLVKPGITGLWQVSGRADLSWEETVRLDLQYVENWTLGLDLLLLAKTVLAVGRGRGAY